MEVERQKTKFAQDNKANEVILMKLSLEKVEKDMQNIVESVRVDNLVGVFFDIKVLMKDMQIKLDGALETLGKQLKEVQTLNAESFTKLRVMQYLQKRQNVETASKTT